MKILLNSNTYNLFLGVKKSVYNAFPRFSTEIGISINFFEKTKELPKSINDSIFGLKIKGCPVTDIRRGIF